MYSFTSNSSTAIGIASFLLNTTGNSIGLSVPTISSKPPILYTRHISYENVPPPQTPRKVLRNLPSLIPTHWNRNRLHQEHSWSKNLNKHLSFWTSPNLLKRITRERAKKGTFH